jgi:rhodanese-related sulfurtransferase
MKYQVTLTGKSLAAAAAVLLALILAISATLVHGAGAAPLDAKSAVQTILAEKDHVTPTELAGWILAKRSDYQLIDIRLPWQYDDYHIPGAINVPLSQLFEDSGLKQLERSKTIVLYGLGAGHAAQAQLMLAMRGYKALSLREGISAWWSDVMTPMSLRSESQSPAGYQQAKQLREHFLGAAGAAPSPAAAPAPVVPETPPAAQPAPGGERKLKLGKGCS